MRGLGLLSFVLNIPMSMQTRESANPVAVQLQFSCSLFNRFAHFSLLSLRVISGTGPLPPSSLSSRSCLSLSSRFSLRSSFDEQFRVASFNPVIAIVLGRRKANHSGRE